MECILDDGRIQGANRQKMRAINFDDSTWALVLNLKDEEEPISQFFRRMVKELAKQKNGR